MCPSSVMVTAPLAVREGEIRLVSIPASGLAFVCAIVNSYSVLTSSFSEKCGVQVLQNGTLR